MAERVRLPGGRITGKIIQWKGKYGWIQPNTTIKHPEAGKRGGKVFLAQQDLESAEVCVGNTVSFFVYDDGNGLGAQHCRAAAGAGTGGVKGVVKSVAPKVQTAQRAAKIAGKTLTKGVQQKYVAVKGHAAVKGQAAIKTVPKLQPTAKSMPSPEGIKGVSQVPNRASRQRLTQRISGTLQKWRGEVGWIRPDSKVEGTRKGQIYVHKIDFKQGNESLVGNAVTFFVYQDDAGVGAEHVIVSGASTKAAATTGKKPAFTPKGMTKNLLPQPKMKGQKAQGQTAPKMTMLQKTKRNRRAKNKGGEKPVKASADLPRTRITDVTVSGEVVEWKGKFGWVMPTDKIEHEKAQLRDGKLYVNAMDVVGGEELTVGQAVEFQVYEDSSGLGAEDCVAV